MVNVGFNKALTLIMVVIAIFTSCKTTINVDKPKEQFVEKTSFERRISVINIPIKIPSSELQNQINKYLNGTIYEDNSFTNNDGDNLKCVVKKHSAIKFSTEDYRLKLDLPLAISGTYKALGVGVDFSGIIRAKYTTSIMLENNWRMRTITKSNGYEWIKKPIVNIGIVDFPVSWIVDFILISQNDLVNSSIDKAVQENIDLLDLIGPSVEMLKDPISVSDTYKTWFQITPVELLVTQLSSKADTVLLTVGLKAYTETVIGDKPKVIKNRDTIPFKVVRDLPKDFNMGIVAVLPYQEVSNLLYKEFVSSGYEYVQGKYRIKFNSISVFAQEDDLIIEVGMYGSINGKIYLKGKPFYESSSKAIIFKDLDYEVDTRQKLLNASDWLAHGTLCKIFTKYMVYPIGEDLDAAKKEAEAYLDNYEPMKGVVVNGKLYNVQTTNLYLIKDAIVSEISVKGKLEVKVVGME